MNIYQQQILDHYRNPRNFGKPKSFAYEGEDENLSCGDAVHVYLQDAQNDDSRKSDLKSQGTDRTTKLAEMHFEGEGCSICLATASLLTEALPGMTHQEILDFSEADLLDLLGIELTTSRRRCATLSLDAVKSALSSFKNS